MQSSAIVRHADGTEHNVAVPQGRAIDLVHLSQQSLGDRNLEFELLGLFDKQADTILTRLMQPASGSDRRWQHDLAHTLKGSARAVGATRVAHFAQAYEEKLAKGCSGAELAESIGQLENAVREARSMIGDLIAGA